jgi:hypothetical protein
MLEIIKENWSIILLCIGIIGLITCKMIIKIKDIQRANNELMIKLDYIKQFSNRRDINKQFENIVKVVPAKYEYEDDLPTGITNDQYSKMFDLSIVVKGVRMFSCVDIEGMRYYIST